MTLMLESCGSAVAVALGVTPGTFPFRADCSATTWAETFPERSKVRTRSRVKPVEGPEKTQVIKG
jgi:hypothetical protein